MDTSESCVNKAKWWVYQRDHTLPSAFSTNHINHEKDLADLYSQLKLALLEKRPGMITGIFERVDDIMRRTPKTSAEHIQDFKYLPIVNKNTKHCQGVVQVMASFMEMLFFTMASEEENLAAHEFFNSVLCSLLENFAFICVLPLNFYSILVLLDYPQPLHIFFTCTWPTLVKTKQIYFLGYCEDVGKYFTMDYVDLYSNFQTFDISRKLNSHGHSLWTLAISVEKVKKKSCHFPFILFQVKSSLSPLVSGHDSSSNSLCCGLDMPNKMGWTPLCWALSLHLLDTAKLLIQHKANVNAISSIQTKKIKPLELAIENQHSDVITIIENASKSKERLVSERFVVEVAARFAVAQNSSGMTFLEGQVTKFHDSQAWLSSQSSKPKCFALVDLNQSVDEEGNTVLHTVVHQENSNLFASFLEWNAALAKFPESQAWCVDPRKQNKKGNTALHMLAKQVKRTLLTLEVNEWCNWIAIVQQLMQVLMHVVGPANFQDTQRQFVNMQNKRGQACLHLLAAISLQNINLIKPELDGSLNSYQVQKMKDYQNLFQYLVEECGASMDLQVDPVLTEKPWAPLNYFKECQLSSCHPKLEQFGKNALMLAISHGNVVFYRYILEKQNLKFDIFQKDKNGNTALHLAILAGEHYYNDESNFYFERSEFSPLLQIHFAIFTKVNSSIEYLVSNIRSTAHAQKEHYTGLWKNTDLFNSLNIQKKSFLHLAVETIVPLRVQDYKVLFDRENGSYFQFQDIFQRTPLMLALSSSKNCNNLPLLMALSKDIVFDMKDSRGKNVFHMLMESFSETRHKLDFFDFLMQEQFQGQWARVSCEAIPQYAPCKEKTFHVNYVLKPQHPPEKEIDIYKNRALVLNQEDQDQRSPFHRAYLEHNETMTLLLLKHGACWHDSSAFFDFVHARSLVNQRHFKSYIEDNFIWRQKILVVREAFKYNGFPNCHICKLCKEILNQIFRLGFQNSHYHEQFMQRLKTNSINNETKRLAYRRSQKLKVEMAIETLSV